MTNKLGAFVRAHRARVTPESIGLPSGERRRIPELRREELAALSGVSTTWITWLEQGRPVSASAKTLARLAKALRLSAAERSYLFKLADKVDPEAGEGSTAIAATPTLSRLVDTIQTPAYVLDRNWNAVAWNTQAATLFPQWLGVHVEGDRNLLHYMFLEHSAREFVVDWQERARRLVAEFRAECGKRADEAPIQALVRQLQEQSCEFLQFWNAHEVVIREGGIRTFKQPDKQSDKQPDSDHISYEQVTLQLQGRPELKLTLLLPAQR